MAENGGLVNLGDLTKPATVLIEKISDAIGGIAKPWQIKRVARAESEAEIIRAEARLEISDIEKRALARMVREEGLKQQNIEAIAAKALPSLSADAQPEKMNNDWIANFFDRCRLVSDEEMQALWAKVLAGEANAPGSFSKRTVELVSTLDKQEAEFFTNTLSFVWTIDGQEYPLICDYLPNLYGEEAIHPSVLQHLDAIGLIRYTMSSTVVEVSGGTIQTSYFGHCVVLEFPREGFHIDLGQVALTRSGTELATICKPSPSNEFFKATLCEWINRGVVLSSPCENNTTVLV